MVFLEAWHHIQRMLVWHWVKKYLNILNILIDKGIRSYWKPLQNILAAWYIGTSLPKQNMCSCKANMLSAANLRIPR